MDKSVDSRRHRQHSDNIGQHRLDNIIASIGFKAILLKQPV